MNGRVVLAHYAEFGTYSGVGEQLAIAAGGLIIYAASAKIDAALAARLARLGQLAFGVCALLFGAAHFFYMNLIAPAGRQIAAAYARVLGLCDRGWPHRGGRCDRGGRAGPPRRDPVDRHVRVLHPAGARADAPRRSLQPYELERECPESRPGRHRLGRGGLARAEEVKCASYCGIRRYWSNTGNAFANEMKQRMRPNPRSTRPLTGGAGAPSARGRVAWFVSRHAKER